MPLSGEDRTDALVVKLMETIDELREQIIEERIDGNNQKPPQIHTDYILTREDFRKLLSQSIELGVGTPHTVSLTLHCGARVIADLVAHAELTDPRGVTDARLSRLRVAICDALDTDGSYRAMNALGEIVNTACVS